MTQNWPRKRKDRIAAKVYELKGQMVLNELRQALDLPQAELAEQLYIKQPAVSRLENPENVSVEHLREVVEAMGGQLDLTARFADLEVKIELRPQSQG